MTKYLLIYPNNTNKVPPNPEHMRLFDSLAEAKQVTKDLVMDWGFVFSINIETNKIETVW